MGNETSQEHLPVIEQICKSGYLYKQSAHLKQTRKRWIVLVGHHLCSYKNEDMSARTEKFDLYIYDCVKLLNDITTNADHDVEQTEFQFEISCSSSKKRRIFIGKSEADVIDWFNKIKLKQNSHNVPALSHDKPKQQTVIKIPISIKHRDKYMFNERYERIIPYDKVHNYTMNSLITDALDYCHLNKAKFCLIKIERKSFINKECNQNNWRNLLGNISDYPLHDVEQKGLYLVIDYVLNYIQMPIHVECKHEQYNLTFEWTVPYYDVDNHAYAIGTLVTEINAYINSRNDPIKFVITKIKSTSFLGTEMNIDGYDWKALAANILLSYPVDDVRQKGLYLNINIDIYKHDISAMQSICTMQTSNTLCPIYAKMRYQDIFSEKSLNHLYDFEHPDDTECEYGDTCYAYQRLEQGGNTLKDRAHVIIYKHPPRGRRGIANNNDDDHEINSFCLNDDWSENKALYDPTEQDRKESECNDKDGFLKLLIREVVDNGFKSDLCLTEEHEKTNTYSLMSIVNDKLNCMRHKRMGSPLNKAEMLAILLYTGEQSNYDLCKAQRNGNYNIWIWFDYCLFNAINKLSKREYGSYKIYTGLASTKLTMKYVKIGYFKTYVSTSWVKQIALSFVDDDGMMFEINDSFRENAICCDVSWISKFGLNECEVLIARSIDAVFNSFECKVIDTQQGGLQIVSLQCYGHQRRKDAKTPVQILGLDEEHHTLEQEKQDEVEPTTSDEEEKHMVKTSQQVHVITDLCQDHHYDIHIFPWNAKHNDPMLSFGAKHNDIPIHSELLCVPTDPNKDETMALRRNKNKEFVNRFISYSVVHQCPRNDYLFFDNIDLKWDKTKSKYEHDSLMYEWENAFQNGIWDEYFEEIEKWNESVLYEYTDEEKKEFVCRKQLIIIQYAGSNTSSDNTDMQLFQLQSRIQKLIADKNEQINELINNLNTQTDNETNVMVGMRRLLDKCQCISTELQIPQTIPLFIHHFYPSCNNLPKILSRIFENSMKLFIPHQIIMLIVEFSVSFDNSMHYDVWYLQRNAKQCGNEIVKLWNDLLFDEKHYSFTENNKYNGSIDNIWIPSQYLLNNENDSLKIIRDEMRKNNMLHIYRQITWSILLQINSLNDLYDHNVQHIGFGSHWLSGGHAYFYKNFTDWDEWSNMDINGRTPYQVMMGSMMYIFGGNIFNSIYALQRIILVNEYDMNPPLFTLHNAYLCKLDERMKEIFPIIIPNLYEHFHTFLGDGSNSMLLQLYAGTMYYDPLLKCYLLELLLFDGLDALVLAFAAFVKCAFSELCQLFTAFADQDIMSNFDLKSMTEQSYGFKDVKSMAKLYNTYRKELIEKYSDKIQLRCNPLLFPVDYREDPGVYIKTEYSDYSDLEGLN
eukprot:465756_1